MADQLLGAGRVFAAHYQFVVCDDPTKFITDDTNWKSENFSQGLAGEPSFRVVGTAAHLNDHWIELVATDQPPSVDEWQRITRAHFRSASGKIHVRSVIDSDPRISTNIEPGDYAIYIVAQNLGVDQLSLGEDFQLTDAEIAARKDIEWYRIFLVPGIPKIEGRVVDHSLPPD